MTGPPPATWIKFTKPSCVLNGTRVTAWTGDQTEMIPEGELPADIFKRVKGSPGHLVLNCHGIADPPLLKLGWDLRPSSIDAWKVLQNLKSIKVIWLAACNLPGSVEGMKFTKAIADAVGCYVVSQIGPAIDGRGFKGHILDNAGSMPVFVDPFGELASRVAFMKAGNALGFQHPTIKPLANPPFED